ncbi:hypothetical protein H0H87_001944, partial [Tephrocybe sp. NHM501043]
MATMDLCIVGTNPSVSTQESLSQVAEVPSITVDLTELDSASATSLTSGEIRSSAMQASTGMLATGPLQDSGSPGTEGSLPNAKVIVLQVPHSTGLGPTGTARNMRIKSGLLTTWSGTQLLLSKVEGLLAGTPFKMPVAPVNVLIKLGNVCPLCYICKLGSARNRMSLRKMMYSKDIIARTEECLGIVAIVLAKEGDTVAHLMIQDFAGSFAHALLNANKEDSVNMASKQMKDLLVNPWKESANGHAPDLPPYLIIIDALDEIDGQGGSKLLKDLLIIVNAGELHGLKFLVTSCPDPGLAALCKSFSTDAVSCLFDVVEEEIKGDIT